MIVYMAFPIKAKIVIMLLNFFLPDPIPWVDEFIMLVGIVAKMDKAVRVWEFITRHKFLVAVSVILVILLVAAVVS